ncbi:MAG: ATP phosphoribosyltransferase [Candidatus Kuenenbacteria bacterium]
MDTIKMNPIRIVVPDGSMEKIVMDLFEKAGMPVTIKNKRLKIGKVDGVDWIDQVVFQRPQEIPRYLNKGLFDVAIVGEDCIANSDYPSIILLKLPIGRKDNKPVKIVLAVSQDSDLQKIEDLPKDCEVATEYIQLAQRFFANLGRNDIKVIFSFGNTESKIGLGEATAIIDVTESGDSLKQNGLKIIYEIMESNTVIMANLKSLIDESKKPYIDCFVRLINGAFQATVNMKLTVNVPEEILNKAATILGGLKGPSCSLILDANGKPTGWLALQSIVPKEKEIEIKFNLLQIGVTDIVVERNIPQIMS